MDGFTAGTPERIPNGTREDYWDVRFGLTRKIKEALDESGIEIPFPQRVVHTLPLDSPN